MLSGRKKRKKKNSPWKAASQHSREDFFLFLSFHWIFLYSFFSGTQKAIFPSPFLSVAKNPLPSHPALQHRCTWVRGERRGLHAALPEMSPSLHFSSKQELPSKKSKDLAFFSHKQYFCPVPPWSCYGWDAASHHQEMAFSGCCQIGCFSSALVPHSDRKNFSDFAAGSALVPDSDIRASLMLINAMTQWINTVLGKAVNYTQIKQKNKGIKVERSDNRHLAFPSASFTNTLAWEKPTSGASSQ